jgi:hypothetical protein
MTNEELAKIEATWAKATPGPWEWDDSNAWIHHDEDDQGNGIIVLEVEMRSEYEDHANLQAIHASRKHVDALLAEVKRLRAPVQWSKEPPTEKGWYWARDPHPIVVYVTDVDSEELVAFHIDSEEPTPLDDVDLWGPKLTPPEGP